MGITSPCEIQPTPPPKYEIIISNLIWDCFNVISKESAEKPSQAGGALQNACLLMQSPSSYAVFARMVHFLLPTKVCKGPVSLCHFVQLVLFLYYRAFIVEGCQQLTGELFRQECPPVLVFSALSDHPFHRQKAPPVVFQGSRDLQKTKRWNVLCIKDTLILSKRSLSSLHVLIGNVYFLLRICASKHWLILSKNCTRRVMVLLRPETQATGPDIAQGNKRSGLALPPEP